MAGSSSRLGKISSRAARPRTSSSACRRSSDAGSRHIVADLQQVDASTVRGAGDGARPQHRPAPGGSFRLANVPPRVMEVIRLSRLDCVLECFDTLTKRTGAPRAVAHPRPCRAHRRGRWPGWSGWTRWLPQLAMATGLGAAGVRQGASSRPAALAAWRLTPVVEILELVVGLPDRTGRHGRPAPHPARHDRCTARWSRRRCCCASRAR